MKNVVILFACALLFLCVYTSFTQKNIEVTVRKAWKLLDDISANAELYGGKLVLAGTVEFVKRSTEPIFITKILLKWRGNNLQTLLGSLYKQPIDKDFFPLEDFWLCDGTWNPKAQHLILTLDRPLLLEAKTTLHLVFTLPPSLESCILNGSFEVEPFSRATSFHDIAPSTSYKLVYASH